MAELVDAVDSKSTAQKAWGFDSLSGHQCSLTLKGNYMSAVQLSRALEIDRTKLVEKAGGSQFELVLLAAAITRTQINAAKKNGINPLHSQVAMDTLLDIQNGKYVITKADVRKMLNY